MTIQIIGLAGREGNGKSTIANSLQRHLEKNGITVARIPFAAPMKGMLSSIGLTYDELFGNQKETPNHKILGGKTPRFAMQTLATEWARDTINPNIWVDAWKYRVETLPELVKVVIIEDVRFVNEVEAIRSLGGQIFAIQRHPDQSTPEGHASTNLDFAANNIPIIDNSGTIEQTLDQLKTFL